MKTFRKLSLALVLSVMGSPVVMGMQNPAATTEHTQPLTPRTMGNVTQRFQTITLELAEENSKYTTGQTTEEIMMDPPVTPGVSKKVYTFENEAEGTQVFGDFPLTTKYSEVLNILSRGHADTSLTVTSLYDSVSENMFVRQISDANKTWFIIFTFSLLPETKADSQAAPAVQTQEQKDHWEIVGKRLEGFVKKARNDIMAIDVKEQGKRLEGFAQKAGKDAEKVGQNIARATKKLFGKK